jgi:hypothetical protein
LPGIFERCGTGENRNRVFAKEYANQIVLFQYKGGKKNKIVREARGQESGIGTSAKRGKLQV